MVEETQRTQIIREAVGSFADRAHFRRAVGQLLAAGFKPDDLSVLASHDSLEVAGSLPGYSGTPAETERNGLVAELPYIAPLTIAGIIMISAGPIAAALAALVGVGVGGAAIKEFLDNYAANQHTEEFAAALEAGAVLLWARVDDRELEATATRILEEAGGRHVHIHGRSIPAS